jgi:cobalt-zinc-cadmium efflux system membrane fusion protein
VPVLSLASGRVVDLRVRLGDTVQKGQVLLTMSSPDVTQAAADLRKFQADAVLAHRALDRAHALSDHEALAAKDLEAAVNADEKAQADVVASEEHLRLLGADPAHPAATIEMRAPVAGTIVEQNVTGSAGVRSLDNSPNLFTIADLSRVWVLCDVYENNLGDVHVGDPAIVTLTAFPDQPLTATVGNISRVLDPATRTAKVRLEIANQDGRMRPGMFATVVFSAQRSETLATVPATAVMRLHDRDWVFVPDGEKRFRRVEVHLGRSGHDGQQTVLSGLHAGDRVVANALQLSSVAES